jgi:hypothetical protein
LEDLKTRYYFEELCRWEGNIKIDVTGVKLVVYIELFRILIGASGEHCNELLGFIIKHGIT